MINNYIYTYIYILESSLTYLQLLAHVQGRSNFQHGSPQLNEHQDVKDKLNAVLPHPLDPPLALFLIIFLQLQSTYLVGGVTFIA